MLKQKNHNNINFKTMSTSIIPASHIQQQFWLNQKLHPEDTTYNISYIWSIKGTLNISFLEKSINDLINTFEIFRTKFIFENGVLNQEIYGSIEYKLLYRLK
jgi:hypothetical protein